MRHVNKADLCLEKQQLSFVWASRKELQRKPLESFLLTLSIENESKQDKKNIRKSHVKIQLFLDNVKSLQKLRA